MAKKLNKDKRSNVLRARCCGPCMTFTMFGLVLVPIGVFFIAAVFALPLWGLECQQQPALGSLTADQTRGHRGAARVCVLQWPIIRSCGGKPTRWCIVVARHFDPPPSLNDVKALGVGDGLHQLLPEPVLVCVLGQE